MGELIAEASVFADRQRSHRLWQPACLSFRSRPNSHIDRVGVQRECCVRLDDRTNEGKRGELTHEHVAVRLHRSTGDRYPRASAKPSNRGSMMPSRRLIAYRAERAYLLLPYPE